MKQRPRQTALSPHPPHPTGNTRNSTAPSCCALIFVIFFAQCGPTLPVCKLPGCRPRIRAKWADFPARMAYMRGGRTFFQNHLLHREKNTEVFHFQIFLCPTPLEKPRSFISCKKCDTFSPVFAASNQAHGVQLPSACLVGQKNEAAAKEGHLKGS